MNRKVFDEHHLRSLIKGITWRLTGTLDTIIISFLITRKISWALPIGVTEMFTKIILYYFHERIWNRVNIGRKIKKISKEKEENNEED